MRRAACSPAAGPWPSSRANRHGLNWTTSSAILQNVTCDWCKGPIPNSARRDSLFCSKRCRQSAYRARREFQLEHASARPLRVAYADPPYPGKAYLYRGQPGEVGEVNHAQLLEQLERFDGWALSTSSDPGLRIVLPLCPPEVKVCAWVKPRGVPANSRGLNRTWEPLIVMPARSETPGLLSPRSAACRSSCVLPRCLVVARATHPRTPQNPLLPRWSRRWFRSRARGFRRGCSRAPGDCPHCR